MALWARMLVAWTSTWDRMACSSSSWAWAQRKRWLTYRTPAATPRVAESLHKVKNIRKSLSYFFYVNQTWCKCEALDLLDVGAGCSIQSQRIANLLWYLISTRWDKPWQWSMTHGSRIEVFQLDPCIKLKPCIAECHCWHNQLIALAKGMPDMPPLHSLTSSLRLGIVCAPNIIVSCTSLQGKPEICSSTGPVNNSLLLEYWE